MSNESRKQWVLSFVEEVWNGRNIAAIPKYLVAGTFYAGNIANSIKFLSTSFPDYEISVEDIIVEEDKVAIRTTLRGTHSGSFRGHSPTGKVIQSQFIGIYKFKENKIVTGVVESDWLVIYQQLGITPQIEGAEVS
jgi:hypothetical protein